MRYSCNHSVFSLILIQIAVMVAFPLLSRASDEPQPSPIPNDRPVIVGLNADYAPLVSFAENGKPKGYDVQFTNLLLKRLGLTFSYASEKWENFTDETRANHTDLGMMIFSPFRRDTTYFSNPLFRLYFQVIYRIADENTFTSRDLRGKDIAFSSSGFMSAMVPAMGAIPHQTDDLEKALFDLSRGQYDAVICFRFQADYYLARNHLTTLKNEDLSFPPLEYCYASHNKALIDAINKELKLMEAEGLINQIYETVIEPKVTSFKIPHWVWALLAGLSVLFLLTLVVIYRLSNKKLEAEHKKLVNANALLERNNNALLIANERALESSRMKTTFIQQISHEIRTPLNAVNGFTEVMTNPNIVLSEEEKKDLSHRINEGTNRITSLVNKIIELSEATSQAVFERNDHVSVQQIVNDAIAGANIKEATHVKFSYYIDPEVQSIPIQTNLKRAARALSLLLDNAKKYTESGEVRLSAEKSSEEGMIVFAVQDTGIGIPVEKAEEIFDAFVQLDDNYDGTGIGLTVARLIARRLGGDIRLDTSYNNGARLVMTLSTTSPSEFIEQT